VPNVWVSVTLLCLVTFINDMAIPVIWAVSTDVGGRYAGTVSGIMNMMSGFGPLISQPLIPVLRTKIGWLPTMTVLAGVWFLAALCWLRIDASERLVQGQPLGNAPDDDA
jgi:hypothetical protein